jgi:tetratricopeptide (TPR) repeat protein
VYAHLGRVEEGVALAREGVDGHESLGLGGYHTHAVLCRAETHILAGRLDDAHAQAERGLALSRERGQRGCEAWSLRLLAAVYAAQEAPSLETADEHYRRALSLAEELGMRPLVAHCHLGLAILSQRTDRREQAQKHLGVATTMYRDMEMRFWFHEAEAAV